MSTHVVMWSGGITSWAAARRIADRHGTDGLVLLFADTKAKATRTGDRTNLAEEVGDVGILLHRLAALYGVDVDQAVREKAASRLARHRGERDG